MARTISITVHPSDLGGEYLTVSDAMKQVLDMIGALEGIEAGDEVERKIVWRLTEAHTNSPPFTIKAQAFPRDPQVSIAMEADRVTKLYAVAVASVLDGEKPRWLESEPGKLLKRALKRNLNGVGHTDVQIEGEEPIIIEPASARVGLSTLEKAEIDEEVDLRRVEFGSVEGQVVGLTRYYSSPALVFQERLSGARVICVLTPELAEEMGPLHQWSEAWEGEYLRLSGKLFYDPAGQLKRINASGYEEIKWADVPISDLRGIDVLNGRTVQQHIDEFWGERFG
jgi:hypothetical protein